MRKLWSQLKKGSGEVLKKHPRCLTKNTSAIIDVEVSRPICIETFKDNRELGRVMLRYSGDTIAVGIVLELVS